MKKRIATYPILDVILNRWSSRAFSDEPISQKELMSLFEAARWAPSSYNNQPWRFIFALKGDPAWQTFLDLIEPSNAVWAKNSAALVLVVSHDNFEYNNKPSRTHTLDAGAATENMALQGWSMGFIVHGMEGFDYDRARTELAIPADYTIEALYAVARPGSKDSLPPELAQRETPSDRKDLKELVFKDRFGQPF